MDFRAAIVWLMFRERSPTYPARFSISRETIINLLGNRRGLWSVTVYLQSGEHRQER